MVSINFISLLLCFILYSILMISSSSSTPITLELTPNPKLFSSQNPIEFISNIAKSTLNRAYHIKYLNKDPSNPTSTPLFPISAGGYSIALSLGTPPQKIPAFFDTGSSLVWVPCTSHYTCFNCTKNNDTITTYLPKKSTTKHSVRCSNKKCRWLDQPNVQASCPACSRALRGSCGKPCYYVQAYGIGDTYGTAMLENLNLQSKVVPDFLVGCSYLSDIMPEGIVGFGRNPSSLPNQLKLTKFSHCFVSHKFDDTLKSSSLILGDPGTIPGLKYTRLVKNPSAYPFNEYYYVYLEHITVGTKNVKVPREVSSPNPNNGNGGTIVDSGTTFTYMDSTVFNQIATQFLNQMIPDQRKQAELLTLSSGGNVLCMFLSSKERKLVFPTVNFYFKGGVKIDLTVDNYFRAGSEDVLCLPFVNTTLSVAQGGSGPAIILGNYQQQNFHIEYDLKHERFGVKKQKCQARS